MKNNRQTSEEVKVLKEEIAALEAVIHTINKIIANKKITINNTLLNAFELYYGHFLKATKSFHEWGASGEIVYEKDTKKLEVLAIYNWGNNITEVKMRQYNKNDCRTFEVLVPLDVAMEVVNEQSN